MRNGFFKGILCFIVALSFFATLVQISSASSGTTNAMACCVDKAAGHCDSGIPVTEIPPPPPEPRCGLDNSDFEDDGITIVAEPAHKESHHSLSQTAETTSHAAESTSVSKPCQMECGTCAASSSRQQRREHGVLQPATYHNPSLITHSKLQNQQLSFSSNEDWERTSPRGPPSYLL
jgi:hypothetical protein